MTVGYLQYPGMNSDQQRIVTTLLLVDNCSRLSFFLGSHWRKSWIPLCPPVLRVDGKEFLGQVDPLRFQWNVSMPY